MRKYRSILSVILAFVIVLLVGFSSVAEAKPAAKTPSYTVEQREQIQTYTSQLSTLRDRLPELATLIQQQDWTYVRNFIHGPLGEMRSTMLNLSRNLLPDAQAPARKAAKTIFDNLVAIDKAADAKDYKAAIRNYAETVRDFEAFLETIPQG